MCGSHKCRDVRVAQKVRAGLGRSAKRDRTVPCDDRHDDGRRGRRYPRAKEYDVAVPGIPEGFDFTDPDVYETRLPIEEFAALRKSAPVWWVAQPPTKGGYPRRRVLGGLPARRRQGGLAQRRGVLHVGEHGDRPLRRRHPPRDRRDDAAPVDQQGCARTHQAPQDHRAWFHPACRPAAAAGVEGAGGTDRPAGRRRRRRRLRHQVACRAAPAGHRGADRCAAGGPRARSSTGRTR